MLKLARNYVAIRSFKGFNQNPPKPHQQETGLFNSYTAYHINTLRIIVEHSVEWRTALHQQISDLAVPDFKRYCTQNR